MSIFRITLRSALSSTEAWNRLTDWERHADLVPFTSIRVTGGSDEGSRAGFTARTGLGRIGFDDPMEVTCWQPPHAERPGLCRLEKRGTVVTGWAEIEVRPWMQDSALQGSVAQDSALQGSVVQWREDLRVAALPRVLDAPTAWCGRLLFGRVMRRLLDSHC